MRARPEITPLQHRALIFIASFIEKNGHAPTIGEIMKGLGRNGKKSTQRLLERLQDKKFLDREHGVQRSLKIRRSPDTFPTEKPIPPELKREGLTPTEQAVYIAILEFTKAHERPPGVSELAKFMGYRSRGGAKHPLIGLHKKGFIDWEPGARTAITIIK